jgi:hypothetical protein
MLTQAASLWCTRSAFPESFPRRPRLFSRPPRGHGYLMQPTQVRGSACTDRRSANAGDQRDDPVEMLPLYNRTSCRVVCRLPFQFMTGPAQVAVRLVLNKCGLTPSR